jgi:hypothetical protein
MIRKFLGLREPVLICHYFRIRIRKSVQGSVSVVKCQGFAKLDIFHLIFFSPARLTCTHFYSVVCLNSLQFKQ